MERNDAIAGYGPEWSADFFDRSGDQAPVPDYHG
jgi:hypothetical protein